MRVLFLPLRHVKRKGRRHQHDKETPSRSALEALPEEDNVKKRIDAVAAVVEQLAQR